MEFMILKRVILSYLILLAGISTVRSQEIPGNPTVHGNFQIDAQTYHPDEALDMVLTYMGQANVPVNRVHQKWMLNRMKDLISPLDHGGRIGMLDPSDYQRVAGELKESGLITEMPDYSSFFVGCEIRAEQ
mgnify:CR=1 FL=1